MSPLPERVHPYPHPLAPSPQEVLESCGAWINRTARRIRDMMPWADLDDLIQHGVMIALEQREHFDPERGVEFPYFVRRRVFGAMIDLLRHDGVRQRGRVSLEDEEYEYAGDSAIDVIIKAENFAALTDSIAVLPEMERHVISLFYLEELNNREIAAVLKISESYANKLRNQALKRIAAMLTGNADTPRKLKE